MFPNFRNIALQREIPYQEQVSKIVSPMSDLPQRLKIEAEEIDLTGFNRFVGPFYRLAETENGAVKRFAFVVAQHHMNAAGSVHGGMLMTFADMAMGHTARIETSSHGASTVSLNCDFVGPGHLHDVVEARVRVTRRTRTVVFLSCEIAAETRQLLVATGLWKLVATS